MICSSSLFSKQPNIGTVFWPTVDDYSRHGVVYYLKSKDQCALAFKAWAENQTSDRLLALHSDHEGEYLSGEMKAILDNKGIKHWLTMPHTSQQNGLAERWNRTILDKARALIHCTGLSLRFWEYAINTAVHTYNRTPTRTIGWRTPHKLWSDGHIPDISYFRIFGCKAYVHTLEAKQQKLNLRSIKMKLMGYKPGSKGYRLWNTNTRSIVLSCNMTFNERSFPYKKITQCAVPAPQPTVSEGPVTIYYNTCDSIDEGSMPQVPTVPTLPLPTMPAQCPTPERAETEFHTPLSQPAAPTPPQCPRPACIWRDLGVPPHSTLPGPSFRPPRPPSLRCLRKNPRPNPLLCPWAYLVGTHLCCTYILPYMTRVNWLCVPPVRLTPIPDIPAISILSCFRSIDASWLTFLFELPFARSCHSSSSPASPPIRARVSQIGSYY